MAKLAFIMAASHSGSTLLAMLLGSHPQATTVGDTAGTSARKDPDYRCSCGHRARECPFWQRVRDRLACRGFGLDVSDFGTCFDYPANRVIDRVLHAEHRGPLLERVRDGVLGLSPGWRRHFRAVAGRNVALVEAVTEVTHTEILVDSSKLPHRLKFLLRIPELDVKVVHLVRDGRGVAHTYMCDNDWSVERSAVEWQRGILAAERLLARLPQARWVQVRYEDLCAHPTTELEKLCVFLGLDPSRVNLDFRSAGLHIFGNKMRLSPDQAVCLDERWRAELTDSQISKIEHLAGEQLARYSYAVNEI